MSEPSRAIRFESGIGNVVLPATEGPEEVGEKAAQGGSRTKGNADADRREKAEGSGGEEAGSQVAAQVGLIGSRVIGENQGVSVLGWQCW